MICRVFIMTEKGGYNGDLFFYRVKRLRNKAQISR